VSTITQTLLRLYPPSWRRRYGDEMEDLLAHQPITVRTAVDLLAGAIDAHLNPQRRTENSESTHEGVRVMTKAWTCSSAIAPKDARRSAAWMVGGSLGLIAFAIALQLQIGRNALSESLVYSAFPASLMLSTECTYLKRYSGAARTLIAVGGAALVVLVLWGAVAIAYRI
jgi:hypothetical protein